MLSNSFLNYQSFELLLLEGPLSRTLLSRKLFETVSDMFDKDTILNQT